MAIAHTEQENRRATMKDVARCAGVTIGTVSHVINGTAPISEETTARVREAIRELNYVPNLAARHMRRKEKRQIGLLIPKLDNNFYARIASVLMEDAYQEDYTVLMLSYEYSSEKEKRGLVNMVQNDTETIVIVNGEDDENSIRKLVASGVHVILADRRSTIPGTSYIAYDNHQVLLETIGFLKQKGYQSIGFLSEPPNISNLSDRFAAYQKGLSQYGYPFRPEHVFISDTFREDHFGNGCRYMEHLLRTHARHELPEAFIVSSDQLA